MKLLYKIRGKVRQGKKRGKKLGFPTANLNLWKKIPEGVYVSKTCLRQGKQKIRKFYPSLTFVGKAKTFNENFFHAQTHLFFFNNSIYNTWVTIKLLKKIRKNKKFPSEKELIKQINLDKKTAEAFFKLKPY